MFKKLESKACRMGFNEIEGTEVLILRRTASVRGQQHCGVCNHNVEAVTIFSLMDRRVEDVDSLKNRVH